MAAIHPKAVKQFLKAERDDHSWMKELSEHRLDRLLDEVNFKPAKADPPLDKHQKVCIILGIAFNSFAFWLDMGLGKTRVSLELLNHWHRKGKLRTALILGPSESVLIGWENQIKEWKIKIPFITLLNSSTQSKWDTVAELEEGLILVTYPGLARMVTKLKPTSKRNKKLKLKPNAALIKRLAKTLDAVVLDEATNIGKKNLYYRTLVKLSKNAPYRLELAGRPFGRDPTMLWSQLYLLDRGESLSSTLGMFRAGFFEGKENYWGGKDYKFNKAKEARFNQVIRHRSIEYSEEEAGAKHKVINQVEEVILPDEATAYYQQFLKQLKRVHAGYEARKNAFIRMRQVSSGFIGVVDDETGAKAELAFAENPKLDRLLELIEAMPRKRKGVIFHEFIYSGNLIEKALKKRKIKFLRLKAGIKNAREIEHQFNNDPNLQILLTSHKLSGFGSNYQIANYCFVYEAPVPVIADEQMRKRLPRKGQKRTVHEYDLVCRGTVDGRILAFHKQGQNLFDALIRNPAALG